MKETLHEFYKLSPKKVDEIWNDGILVLDTNVLLDLYRLGKTARRDLKKSIDFFGERVWIPYQVALEFHRNREQVIKDLGGAMYDRFKKTLNDSLALVVKDQFKDFRKHPCIDFAYIEKALDRFTQDLNNKVEVWEKAYPFKVDDDSILKWVTKKFEGRVGEDNTKEELLSIYKDGNIRYQAQLPPGYKDLANKDKKEAGLRFLYGDLIIWLSVIRKAKEDKKDVILLTNDTKEDWYDKHKGQMKGPRFELLREFHKETGRDIIIMTEAAFLAEARAKTGVEVQKSSIEDAEKALAPELVLEPFASPKWEGLSYLNSVFSPKFLESYKSFHKYYGLLDTINEPVQPATVNVPPLYESVLNRYPSGWINESVLEHREVEPDIEKDK